MAGVDVRELAGKRIVFGKHCGGEALSPQAMFASIAIQTDGERSEWQALRSKRAQAGLERGHEERGRDAFSGDVGHYQHQLAAGCGVRERIKSVIVIACDGILRSGPEGDLGIGNHRGLAKERAKSEFRGRFPDRAS